MQATRRIAVLSVAAGTGLALGIPLALLTTPLSTEMAGGTVLSVDPAGRSVMIHDDAGSRELRGRDVLLHLTPGQRVRLARGSESLEQLQPGQRVSARVSTRTYVARWIDLTGDP